MKSVKRGAAVLLLALLAGCVPVVQGLRSSLAGYQEVLGGAITVAPPKGYCIDKDAIQEQDDTAVVLMGRCNDDDRVPAAVVSVTVGTAGSAAALALGGAALTAYFTSDEGRSALSVTGNPANVTLLYASDADGAFVMYLEDLAKGRYWRAVAGERGRLITLSVTPHQAGNVGQDVWRAVLEEAIMAMRRANA